MLFIILTKQIILVSINYFNYKTIIKLDIKYNRNENHPLFISIVNTIDYSSIEEACMNINKHFYNYAYVTPLITNCPQKMNITSKDFLLEIMNRKFDQICNYSLELNNQVMNLKDIPIIHAYYLKKDFAWPDYAIHFNTINITEYLDINHFRNEFFKFWISINSTNKGEFEYYYNKNYIDFSSYNTLDSYRIDFQPGSLSYDQTIKVTKVIHNNLRPPYGQCSDYVEDRPFNGTNQWHCYRQCIKTMVENVFKCKPVLIGNTFHELDYINDNYIECDLLGQRDVDKYLRANNLDIKCMDRCPKNCLNIDFTKNWIRKAENDEINYGNSQRKLSMIWDTTKPMFVYNEELVLSFIDYMCYCGGLVGLLFGASAVDILYKLFNKTIWINIFVIIKNIRIKVIYIFASICESLYQYMDLLRQRNVWR